MYILLDALEFQRNSVVVLAEGPNMDLLAGAPGAGKHPNHPSTMYDIPDQQVVQRISSEDFESYDPPGSQKSHGCVEPRIFA